MQNTATCKNKYPAQALSEEERDRIEFERDWENGLTPEEFRVYAKEQLRKYYEAHKRQK